jgi:hypothetical protein
MGLRRRITGGSITHALCGVWTGKNAFCGITCDHRDEKSPTSTSAASSPPGSGAIMTRRGEEMPFVGRNRIQRLRLPSQYMFVVPCMENNNHLAVRACTSFLLAMAMTVAVARRWRDTAAFPPLNGDFVVTEAIARPG